MKCKHQITIDKKGIFKLNFEDFVRDCIVAEISSVFYDPETNYLVNYAYWTQSICKKSEDLFIALTFVTEVAYTEAPIQKYMKYIIYDNEIDTIKYVDNISEIDFSNHGGSIMVLKECKTYNEVIKIIREIEKDR